MSLQPDSKPVPREEERAIQAKFTPESEKLPPFLQEGVRHREAYLQLIMGLNVILSQEWQSQPEVKVREKISGVIADSMKIWI